jgi:hypothetical protein
MRRSRYLELLAAVRAEGAAAATFTLGNKFMCRREPNKSAEMLDLFRPHLNQSGIICRVCAAVSAAWGKSCRAFLQARQKPPGGIFPRPPKSMLSEI